MVSKLDYLVMGMEEKCQLAYSFMFGNNHISDRRSSDWNAITFYVVNLTYIIDLVEDCYSGVFHILQVGFRQKIQVFLFG